MRVPGVPYVQGRNRYTDTDGAKFGIAIHNTANDASAEAEASYATWRTDGISAHFYVDSDSVIQSLDTASKAGHAGSWQGNEHAVAVEITGFNGWTRQQWLDRVAWDQLGPVLAQVCRYYGIALRRASVAEMKTNPRVRAFYGHDDMRLAWGSTTHTDPGSNFPWDRLFAAVGGDDVSFQDIIPATGNRRAEVCLSDIWNAIATGHSGYVPTQALFINAQLGHIATVLAAVASKVDIDPAELAAVTEAARAGAAAGAEAGLVSAADELAIAVVAALPEGDLTRADVEAAVRAVLGSLNDPQG